MSLVPGTRLGPYEIVAPLGAGGMGEVYRARDPRLGRDVAIKVLPPALTGDPERLARFDREAKLLAAMNHAGIAAIYGLEDAGGHPALVMELVEGPTLAERLEQGPLPEDEALQVGRQIAEALEYAHDRGIVHRDLKPANVKLRPDGAVKVLDFGLARALDTSAGAAPGELINSPTLTQRMTTLGVVLGTAAYMAPEQARGREADRRADIWAFGAVLFEMLTGQRAFAGETVSDTLASVMRDEPEWGRLPASLAAFWRPLMARCLTKDVRARLQAIGEARIALSAPAVLASGPVTTNGGTPVTAAPKPSRTSLLFALSAALLVIAAFAWRGARPRPAPPTATEVDVMLGPGERFSLERSYGFFAIAPDGRSLVYAARKAGPANLRLRRLDRREEVELPGTEGARNPFFSPDGDWIGFFNSLKLCKVSVHGGLPVVLAESGQDRFGTWLGDGTIVFARDTTSPLLRIPAAGGAPVAVTSLDSAQQERTHRFPCALAGGPWVVFTVGRKDSPGGYDDSPIDAVNVDTGERRRIVKGARCAVWAAPGYLVFDRAGDLYAVPIDPRNPQPGAEPVTVLEGVAGETASGIGYFSIASEGTLAWLPGDEHASDRLIGWYDRSGRWSPVPIAAGPYLKLALSPDCTRALVLAGPGGGSSDLWLADLASGGMTRLTYGTRANPALWLPGGQRIAYTQNQPDGGALFVRRLDAAGGERQVYQANCPQVLTSLTPDGRRALVSDFGPREGRMRLVNLDGVADIQEFPSDAGEIYYDASGMISPDGRWIAYVSNRTRREEVYVRSLDGTGGRWQVSNGGGGAPRWGCDSNELFYVQRDDQSIIRVPLQSHGNELVLGRPEPLFELPYAVWEPAYRDFDYDRIHDRFLVTKPAADSDVYHGISLSLAWTSRLGKIMAARQGKP